MAVIAVEAAEDENETPHFLQTRMIVTIGLMLAMLLTAMESTVVSTAMPTVIGDLKGIKLYPWVMSAYLLTSTTTVPIYGKLSDLFGRRRVFLFSTVLFLVGSVLSGAAHSMPQLIIFRALQGLGAGGVLPVTLTIIGDLFPMKQRAKVQALFTSMWATASLTGPLIGALLTEHLSWRWVFYINLPFGLLSLLLVVGWLKEKSRLSSVISIDYIGSILLTVTVYILLTLLLGTGTGSDYFTLHNLLLLLLVIALTAAFIWQEIRAKDPMLPMHLFRHPIILAAFVGNAVIGIMLYSVETFLPLFMQGVRGESAHSASIVLTPLVLGWALSAYFGGKALMRFGFQKTVAFGVACILISAVSLAFLDAHTAAIRIMMTMGTLGTGLGPCSIAFLISAQNVVEWRERGAVTASSLFFRTIGGTIGVGTLGAILNWQISSKLLSSGIQMISPNGLLNSKERLNMSQPALHAAQNALAEGLHLLFILMAVTASAGLLCILLIARQPIEEGRGKREEGRGKRE